MPLLAPSVIGLVLWASIHPADQWSPADDAEWLAKQRPARVAESVAPGQPAAPLGLAEAPPDVRIARGELSRHVGRSVRLKMVSGADRLGTIEDVSEGQLQLRARLHGGYAGYRIALDQIQYALPVE
jgi:hypothetical protein